MVYKVLEREKRNIWNKNISWGKDKKEEREIE